MKNLTGGFYFPTVNPPVTLSDKQNNICSPIQPSYLIRHTHTLTLTTHTTTHTFCLLVLTAHPHPLPAHHRRLSAGAPPSRIFVVQCSLPVFTFPVFFHTIVELPSSVFENRRRLVLASSRRFPWRSSRKQSSIRPRHLLVLASSFSWRLGFPSTSLFNARVSACRSSRRCCCIQPPCPASSPPSYSYNALFFTIQKASYHLPNLRDAEIRNLVIQQGWLQIVKGEEEEENNDAVESLKKDLNCIGFNSFR
ncbi:hypothetical protein PIB30_089530 [Stylosanthes scabra]|uniref:Uncharacterized protein n=1 Tax=Stylosanthes scabra TaxID=79078 RepID=A0ABU6VSH2_9FABA|nr:hypothetical protein [Stylosanthes scabra]